MLLVGLTGGIATGKSTVSRMLQRLGAKIVDADVIARRVVAPQTEAWREIVQHFGQEVLLADGSLHRQKLAEVIFRDEEKRRLLNSIVHPWVLREEALRIAELARQDPGAVVVVDAALLIEVGNHLNMDQVVIVYADEEVQLKRLALRDGLTREDAQERIRAQMPLREKLRYADVVIDNSGRLEETQAQVERLYQQLCHQAKAVKFSKATHKKES